MAIATVTVLPTAEITVNLRNNLTAAKDEGELGVKPSAPSVFVNGRLNSVKMAEFVVDSIGIIASAYIDCQ